MDCFCNTKNSIAKKLTTINLIIIIIIIIIISSSSISFRVFGVINLINLRVMLFCRKKHVQLQLHHYLDGYNHNCSKIVVVLCLLQLMVHQHGCKIACFLNRSMIRERHLELMAILCQTIKMNRRSAIHKCSGRR